MSHTERYAYTLRLICASVVFMMLPLVCSAQDPSIKICSSSCDPPTIIDLTQTNGALNDVVATGADNVNYEFLNLTGTIIDDLAFTAAITPELDPTMLGGLFSCTAPNGFFLNCAVTYDPGTGALTTYYYGVNPPDWQDLPVVVIFEDLTGGNSGNTGIPNLGLFSVNLSGWVDDLDDGAIYGATVPSFSNSFNVPVNLPEPSTALIFPTELLLFAGGLALLGRKRKWKWTFGTQQDR